MRFTVFLPMLTLFLLAVVAQGQTPTSAPQDQLRQMEQALQQLQAYRQTVLEYQGYVAQPQQGGGGRGAAPGAVATPFGTFRSLTLTPGAWWTNPNVLTQLGLTDDQKAKIEKSYENHKQNVAMDSAALDAQEKRLSELLASDPVDHNAVLGQIDRVAQARADLERTNSAMTLEMREVLTASQWTKLQSQPVWLSGDINVIRTPFGDVVNPNPNGGPGQRNSGQRSGQRQ